MPYHSFINLCRTQSRLIIYIYQSASLIYHYKHAVLSSTFIFTYHLAINLKRLANMNAALAHRDQGEKLLVEHHEWRGIRNAEK